MASNSGLEPTSRICQCKSLALLPRNQTGQTRTFRSPQNIRFGKINPANRNSHTADPSPDNIVLPDSSALFSFFD